MDNNLDINKNNKIELALASLMFFAPFVKYNLKTREDISSLDKNFILWFIRLWYLNIFLLFLAIASQILYYVTNILFLNTCSTIIIIVLAVLLLIWSIFVLTEKSIVKANVTNDKWVEAVWYNNLSQIILAYIPLYNVYLWYEKHDFDWDNLYMKESLILRWIFSILLAITSNKYILLWFWAIILFVMLLNIFNVRFWDSHEQFLKNLFKKNPEEIWWGILWVCIAPFKWETVKETIDNQKSKYSLIFKLDHKQILLELIIAIFLYWLWVYLWIKTVNYCLIIWISLILARYLIMLIKWKHMSHIPIIREITNLFFISKQK